MGSDRLQTDPRVGASFTQELVSHPLAWQSQSRLLFMLLKCFLRKLPHVSWSSVCERVAFVSLPIFQFFFQLVMMSFLVFEQDYCGYKLQIKNKWSSGKFKISITGGFCSMLKGDVWFI